MTLNNKSTSSKTKKKKRLYGGESVSISAPRGFSKKMGLGSSIKKSKKSIKESPSIPIKNNIIKESVKSKKKKKNLQIKLIIYNQLKIIIIHHLVFQDKRD